VFDDIAERGHAISADHEETIRALQQDVDSLTDGLSAVAADETSVLVLLYYRARARAYINVIRGHDAQPMDEAMAHQIIHDLDAVLAAGVEAPEWGLKTAEVQFLAGTVSREQLHDETRAYGYLEACALRGQAGCMNLMANARLTGVDGQKVDVREALDYHTRVFESGTRFRCAGFLSARSIARIIYFTGVRRQDDDELDWLRRAHALLAKLEDREHQKGQCDSYGAAIEEFLYRMARGTTDTSILAPALELPGTTQNRKAILQYLSGGIDDRTFKAAINLKEMLLNGCDVYFYATWYAELTNRHALAQEYFHTLADPDHHCSSSVFYLDKKFGFTGPGAAKDAREQPR
jgi:hypothetical protein